MLNLCWLYFERSLVDGIFDRERDKTADFKTVQNKPRTAKVGAISKAQNLKGGPFGLCETPAGCKKF